MPVEAMLALSERLRKFSNTVGKLGSLFIMPLVAVTIWDVAIRKVGHIQVWLIENVSQYLGSTIVQELEWHFHTAFFALVLGYGFVNNRHVRVDLVREKLPFRVQGWIEFLGCTFFMVPYCLIVGWFAAEVAYQSYLVGEISASTVGLSYRWIIRSVLMIGLFVAAIAGIAVWLQTVLVLFGPKDFRFDLMTLQWPETQAAAKVQQAADRVTQTREREETRARIASDRQAKVDDRTARTDAKKP